ncbi:hypothetical protein N7454_003241 [Penicillium verhagenii]|nr:hypothetical protein N7454_003241 [Penicillium verhagenii]
MSGIHLSPHKKDNLSYTETDQLPPSAGQEGLTQYFKLSPNKPLDLNGVLHLLSQKHIFYTVGEEVAFSSVDINTAKDVALSDRILLVCAKDPPKQRKGETRLTLCPQDLNTGILPKWGPLCLEGGNKLPPPLRYSSLVR